jgi:putative MATE family efflux protein
MISQDDQAANPTPPRATWRRILSDIGAGLKGSDQDYTTGSVGRAIFVLAVPMVLEMIMESIFAVVDVFFVARLGPSAVATVGLTESVITLIYAVAFGFAMGTTAMIARRIGEKNVEGAQTAAMQAIIIAVACSIPMAIVGLFFADNVLSLMGADDWSLEHGVSYTRWLLGGNVVIMLIFILNAVFRGAGDAAIAMRVLWLANGINIVLDPALITGWGPFPEMGIRGAAIATNIGRGAGVCLQLYVLFFGSGRIRLASSQATVHAKTLWRLVRVSLGGVGQFVIAMASWIGLMRIMSTFGSEALAGYTIAVRIAMFSILPAWGMSNAAATLVGQGLGAKKPERAEKAVWMCGWSTMVFLGMIGVTFIIFNEELVRIFTHEPGVVAIGADCLRIFAYGYLVFAWGMVMVQAFNGAGDTYTPTWINLFCFWLFELPFAYLLAIKLGVGERGVYVSVVAAETLMTIVAIILFRRGKWKTRQV